MTGFGPSKCGRRGWSLRQARSPFTAGRLTPVRSRNLADQLGAAPAFRADGNYELGELLPSVLARMKLLYGRVADAAQSWGNTQAKESAAKRKQALSSSNAETSVE